MQNRSSYLGFSLIELIVSLTIVSLILLGGFQALSSVTVGKVRLIEKTNIEKQAFYFSEKLFDMIQRGGVIDYEEYWNRESIGATSYGSGHFDIPSGFGNFGANGIVGSSNYGETFYFCLSTPASDLGSSGCLEDNHTNFNNQLTNSSSYRGNQQRYGQYAVQFIDFNGNADADGSLPGDENGDGNILGDDDDRYLGNGPEVFAHGTNISELYLISEDGKTRTFFRWKVSDDPEAPSGASCSSPDLGQSWTGSGCLGTVQFLTLQAKDWGSNHNVSNIPSDGSLYDGVIDTWVIDPKFHGGAGDIIAGSNTQDYWVDLFPASIHVSDFEVYAYPNKDRNRAWKDDQTQVNIAPYVRLTLKLSPSWSKRKLITGSIPEFDFSTTISLNTFQN